MNSDQTRCALVIDGNSLFYRCYYATSNLVEWAIQNNYLPNNAIKLMLNMVIKLIDTKKYSHCLIAFDNKVKSFRQELLTSYKQNRTKAPQPLYDQLDDTMLALAALGIKVISKPYFEADDLIGSFVKIMNKANINVEIISSDKDMTQLVNPLTKLLLVKQGINDLEEVNINNFALKFHNLSPNQIIDWKAIVGDKSDNIKGINGIGDKSAFTLLNKYQSLEDIYAHLDELSPVLKTKFISAHDDVFLYKKIITILTNGLDDFSLNDFLISTNRNLDVLSEIIKKYHLKQLKDYLLL